MPAAAAAHVDSAAVAPAPVSRRQHICLLSAAPYTAAELRKLNPVRARHGAAEEKDGARAPCARVYTIIEPVFESAHARDAGAGDASGGGALVARVRVYDLSD